MPDPRDDDETIALDDIEVVDGEMGADVEGDDGIALDGIPMYEADAGPPPSMAELHASAPDPTRETLGDKARELWGALSGDMGERAWEGAKNPYNAQHGYAHATGDAEALERLAQQEMDPVYQIGQGASEMALGAGAGGLLGMLGKGAGAGATVARGAQKALPAIEGGMSSAMRTGDPLSLDTAMGAGVSAAAPALAKGASSLAGYVGKRAIGNEAAGRVARGMDIDTENLGRLGRKVVDKAKSAVGRPAPYAFREVGETSLPRAAADAGKAALKFGRWAVEGAARPVASSAFELGLSDLGTAQAQDYPAPSSYADVADESMYSPARPAPADADMEALRELSQDEALSAYPKLQRSVQEALSQFYLDGQPPDPSVMAALKYKLASTPGVDWAGVDPSRRRMPASEEP